MHQETKSKIENLEYQNAELKLMVAQGAMVIDECIDNLTARQFLAQHTQDLIWLQDWFRTARGYLNGIGHGKSREEIERQRQAETGEAEKEEGAEEKEGEAVT